MALDARRRQKKAEKRKAKERAKHKELARRKAEDIGVRLARVTAAPILHCCTTQALWDQGIASVLFSRDLTSGQVAFAVFLVDRFCLGVKDVYCNFMPRSEYFEQVYEGLDGTGDIVALKPAAARKLVEGAAAYARDLGFSPHADFASARQIFGDIDPAASDQEFEFGKDGKPFFISGPHDSVGRCASIVGILSERCAPGGFDYLVGVPGSTLFLGGEESEFDDEGADETDEDSDETIDGVASPQSPPPRPTSMAASLRRMIFGGE